MFNSKRIKALEDRNTELLERVRELGDEVAKLKRACTMRVGEHKPSQSSLYGYLFSDSRPTATAIELIQQLMERQKLTVEAVPASPATFTVTKSN
ncbi:MULTISPECIES: hypothetical protein [unclassified Polaromonas]|jgi:hypothetical protein|uniref:hypothetical protein n=1 Tax=unclassified Polaromonas TaxID=2638319 RepID=UPI000BD83C80|nr:MULTISPECIES: hypothetical protein [unclassified Polaromonas]OYY34762.1 MAG: hypothetical protein B7Y60_15085 [Polaromonas sp. 35-63-35]OYZ19351.1 MAG: hypothetical protein B7Y28_12505 [Polaromonas sp. 16-63-31]OYZ77522.1 MAG: hypothetical protein B7Y09_16240 [Polaromonas sp. 24-63-21]OZA48494.1 MAG: hypothetical protein B7X88_18275 [Polaromonas sp. 17-63-33]OZA87243.1 MAG: hypothetical protein B7X65_13750 [Polaromonas sp. 39-63-25]